MKPTRAAWFFAAGLVWLVLRGILVQSLPQIRTDYVAEHGGLLLVIPLISVVASLTMPVFFLSFLRHHRFAGRWFLQATTVVAAIASLLSSLLALTALVVAVGGIRPPDFPFLLSSPGLLQTVSLVLVGSVFLFLSAFARSGEWAVRLRRAAAIGAAGVAMSVVMVVVWILDFRHPDLLDWYPAVSGSLAAKVIGLAAAGSLLWFLETFAATYDDGGDAASLDRGRPFLRQRR